MIHIQCIFVVYFQCVYLTCTFIVFHGVHIKHVCSVCICSVFIQCILCTFSAHCVYSLRCMQCVVGEADLSVKCQILIIFHTLSVGCLCMCPNIPHRPLPNKSFTNIISPLLFLLSVPPPPTISVFRSQSTCLCCGEADR